MIIIRHSLVAILFFVSLGASGAEDRIAKAVFIDPPKDAPRKVYFVALEEESVEVELPRRNFSDEIILPAGDLVYAVLPRELAEGESIPAGVPKVKINKNWDRVYLLFVFDKSKKFPLKVTPIDGSASKFPAGHTRIVNLSQAKIRGKFGNKELDLAPNTIKNLEPVLNKLGHYPVALNYLEKGEKKSKPLSRTTWQHDPKSRQVILISKPAGARFPQVKSLTDRVVVAQ